MPNEEKKVNDWKTIVLMAFNGAGIPQEEAEMQIRAITPMIDEYIASVREEAYAEGFANGVEEAREETISILNTISKPFINELTDKS